MKNNVNKCKTRDTKERTERIRRRQEKTEITDRHEVIILQINRRNRYARILRYRIVRFP